MSSDTKDKATEEEAVTTEGEAAVAKKSPLKLILFIAVPLLLLGAIGGTLYFTSFGRHLIGLEDKEAGKPKAEEKKEIEKTSFFDLPNLLVNLNVQGKPKFLKLSLTLEVADEKEATQLKDITPRIVDEMQVYLRELVPEDLKGSEGIYRLRDELLKRVNMETKPIVVKNVLFKDFLIQ